MKQGTEGATILAPVAAAYAVDPVGVATITPTKYQDIINEIFSFNSCFPF